MAREGDGRAGDDDDADAHDNNQTRMFDEQHVGRGTKHGDVDELAEMMQDTRVGLEERGCEYGGVDGWC